MELKDLGWSDHFAEHFRPHAGAGLTPARVAVEHRSGYELYSIEGGLTAEVSGRFRHQTAAPGDFPAVGDWVAVQLLPAEAKAVIQAVLPRRSRFSRTAAGDAGEEQILAANIETIFVVSSLDANLNPRRIERYLTLAWESGANPVVVLTKADLCGDVPCAVREVETIAAGAPIVAISTLNGQGIEQLQRHLRPAETGALLGSSGVGKSTLINHLCGDEILDVQPVRDADSKGRHTTTRRELIILPSGALMIDTPGMRELQLWDGGDGIEEAFADIAALAAGCRFTDCRHETEPGCAVLAAIESGQLDPARLASHQKLRRELEHFDRRHDPLAQARQRQRNKIIERSLRTQLKNKR
jgi:ribosome biogenesis GTPase